MKAITTLIWGRMRNFTSNFTSNIFKTVTTFSVLLALTACATTPLHSNVAQTQSTMASTGSYLKESDLTVATYLPAPPALNSPEEKADLQAVMAIQKSRTKAQTEKGVADIAENIWRFSSTIDNPKFTKENLPVVTKFFERVFATEAMITDPLKKKWNRPRPFLVDSHLKPVVDRPKSGSYPSGHSTIGTVMGLLLSMMLPEKRDQIMARSVEFANNRVLVGVHFPSDVTAGRISGTLITATLMTHPEFVADFKAAQTELRSVLALP